MSTSTLPALPSATVDQAIEWSIRLTYNRPDPATRAAFQAWLADDETHRLAWARMQSLSGHFAGVPSGLARQALEKLPEARLQRRQVLKLLALFAVVGTTAWGTRETAPWQRLMADYSTRVGEHQRWTLADGSQLELNTDSAVRVYFDARQRRIDLLRGELYLVSGADSASLQQRPLQVTTTLATFTAHGSRCNIRQYADACRLGVAEGTVNIQPRSGTGAVAQPGETWQVTRDNVLRLPGNAEDAAAWRDGLLTARAMPLAELLDELGRYRNGYLGCDQQVAKRTISGNFNLNDTDATLAFIAQAHGLRVQAMTRYWVRLSA